MGVLKRKNLLVSILFLCLLLLASLSMAATAKSEASIKVETSLEDSSIKVQIPQGVFQDEDVSIVCFAQGWNQDLSRMEENLGYIQYMDQSVISSKGGTFFVALKDQADKNSIYTLVMSADSLKSPIQKQFSFGENTVEVTFDANGGNVSPETSLINKGSTVRLPEAVRTNFYFGGWTTEDGTEVTSESVFQEDTTLYAKWNPYTLENWQDYYATSGWETVDLGTGNTGKQVAEFEIQPLDGRQDGAIYLTGRDAVLNDWGDGPVVIRLNTDGYFDARNGAAFEMTSQVSYQAGETYHLKAIIDVDAKKYTVLVTAPDGKEQVVAQDFVFRTGAKEIQDIGKICIRCGSGSVQGRFIVRNLSLKPYEEPAVEKYTVSLDANGGTVTPQSMEVVKGETLQLPVPVPGRL